MFLWTLSLISTNQLKTLTKKRLPHRSRGSSVHRLHFGFKARCGDSCLYTQLLGRKITWAKKFKVSLGKSLTQKQTTPCPPNYNSSLVSRLPADPKKFSNLLASTNCRSQFPESLLDVVIHFYCFGFSKAPCQIHHSNFLKARPALYPDLGPRAKP
jgi:hypothetical protein